MPRMDKRWILLMHILFLFYSAGSVCSKIASGEPFMSLKFILFYSIVLLILVGYAVGWQQVIKHVPLMRIKRLRLFGEFYGEPCCFRNALHGERLLGR